MGSSSSHVVKGSWNIGANFSTFDPDKTYVNCDSLVVIRRENSVIVLILFDMSTRLISSVDKCVVGTDYSICDVFTCWRSAKFIIGTTLLCSDCWNNIRQVKRVRHAVIMNDHIMVKGDACYTKIKYRWPIAKNHDLCGQILSAYVNYHAIRWALLCVLVKRMPIRVRLMMSWVYCNQC